jgi:predicted SAM-dependent methyltransferase
MEVVGLTGKQTKTMYENLHSHEYKGDMVGASVVRMAAPYFRGAFSYSLDVGAGNGALIKAFHARWGCRHYINGIDIAPKSNLVDKGDCTAMRYGSSRYDYVFCTDVVEHLAAADLHKCIKEIHRVLRPGGVLFLTTINNENLQQRLVCCPGCSRTFHPNGHCQVFSTERIRQVLSGFEAEKIRELNLGFISAIGWPARIFYGLHLHRIKPVEKLTSDLFVVARKK